jgi:CheY-like chemotaxis protein
LSNAVKFTKKGGRIQVRLQRIDSHVEVIVADTGRGIAPQFLPYVFDRFRQADSSISRMHGGLGLGLAIVRHLVELHGGTVQATSPGEGQGATFTVQLPLTVAHGLGRLESEGGHRSEGDVDRALDSTPSLEGLRILVLDDDTDARDLLKVILEERNAQVTTAASPTQAYEILEKLKPDVIISDIGMPGEDGFTFIKKVRAKEAQERRGWKPAIALTAHARIEDRLRALSAGYQAHVPKPVEPAELVAVIASLVRPIS